MYKYPLFHWRNIYSTICIIPDFLYLNYIPKEECDRTSHATFSDGEVEAGTEIPSEEQVYKRK